MRRKGFHVSYGGGLRLDKHCFNLIFQIKNKLYKMDISNLPYETQFKFLLDLSPKEILNYCKNSKKTRLICETREFWEKKARREFGIYDFITENNPSLEYVSLEDAYENHPEDLLPFLIETEQVEKVEEILSTIDLYTIKEKNENIKVHVKDIKSIVHAIFKTKNEHLFELLLKNLGDTFENLSRRVKNVFGYTIIPSIILDQIFIDTIHNMPGWLDIIKKYYFIREDDNPDAPRSLIKTYVKSIIMGDWLAIEYFLSIYKNMVSGYLQISSAIESGNPEIINYYVNLLPHVLKRRDLVEHMGNKFLEEGNLDSLKILVSLSVAVNEEMIKYWISEFSRNKEAVQYLKGLTNVKE